MVQLGRAEYRPRSAIAASVATAALLALIVAAAAWDGDKEGIGGVLRFREDGNGVTVLGLWLLASFSMLTALLVGSLVSAGHWAYTAPAALIAKVILITAVIFMFAFPDLSQFEAKSLTWRAVLYPTLGLGPVAIWRFRTPDAPFPWLTDLCWSYVLLFDIVSNDLHWYGTWTHWDDFVHFANSIPCIVVMTVPLLALERSGRISMRTWGVLVFALTIYVSLHTLWEIEEFAADRFLGTNLQPGGMEEASRNNVAGIGGALLGLSLMAHWNRTGRLDGTTDPIRAWLGRLRAGHN